MVSKRGRRFWPALLIGTCLLPGTANARLDLASASIDRLDNGLTVMVLEEPAFPLVSVQMLYRVGAKHEPAGATGLAHFLEHMAFRSSESFPNTELASSIYAAGGEWHGYTWLDQTTYFETAPVDELELLLRIEAERMARLLIPEDEVGAERGAILAEMHGYESDPATVLHDNVLYVSFLAHPYRNNTIGWESDVAGIRHEELVEFYRRHYHPGNAVLAIVGDVRREDVVPRVRTLFGPMQGRAPTPDPRTVEPRQMGERRIRLQGAVERKHFEIAWRAPSVHNADFPAFLVAQELLAGGSGVNFLQNDWGTPARPDSPLGSVAEEVLTWYPPSAQDYVFTVSGSLPARGDETALEAAVTRSVAGLEEELESDSRFAHAALQRAKQSVARELLFDLRTTEDAAHQLTYFGGMDALEVLTGLPQSLERVSRTDVTRVLRGYFGPEHRTIGWFVPASTSDAAVGRDPAARGSAASTRPADPAESQATAAELMAVAAGPSREPGSERAPPPLLERLSNDTPVLLQRSPLSPTVLIKAVVSGAAAAEGATVRPNEPSWGLTSLDFECLPGEMGAVLDGLRAVIQAQPAPAGAAKTASNEPGERLEQHFQDLLGLSTTDGAVGERPLPLLFVVSGDVDPKVTLRNLEEAFAGLPRATLGQPRPLNATARLELESSIETSVAQEQLGYVVRAPGPGQPDAMAWWLTLYVLSHGYEGRLGQEAISRRGLVYYIDSTYHSNGDEGWITLTMGVDPAKLPAMRELLRAELERLREEPPSQTEIAEARRHVLGRFTSAAQSNPELADRLARDWLWRGQLPDYNSLRAMTDQVSREDVLKLLPAFTAGSIVSVRNSAPARSSPLD